MMVILLVYIFILLNKMSEKSYKFQYSNYQENKLILENIINENIITMSHGLIHTAIIHLKY